MIEKKGQALVVARSRRFRGNKIPTVDVKQFHIADRNALNVCWSNKMTTKKLLGLLLASLVAGGVSRSGVADPEFVYPKVPFAPAKREAPSGKVTNGTVYETGLLRIQAGQTLILPEDVVVTRHKGANVGVYVTKTLRCKGQPPKTMKFDESYSLWGLASRADKDKKTIEIATFGEWANRGGSARIKLHVVVPSGTKIKRDPRLQGQKSIAATPHNINDKAFADQYWYAGPRAAEGWKEVQTNLHFNRFVAP